MAACANGGAARLGPIIGICGTRRVRSTRSTVKRALYAGHVSDQVLPVGRVFVPGGNPTFTYVPRSELRLEGSIDEYLAERGKVLSVSGPTKTGKTVLLKSRVPSAIWVSGGTIASSDDFWEAISSRLELFTEEGLQSRSATSDSNRGAAGLNVAIIKGEIGSSSTSTDESGRALSRKRSKQSASRDEILRDPWAFTVIVDDFHYVPQEVQVKIIRATKDLVFEGMGLIVVAVPHRAYDVVRVEKEMTGRVRQLEVGFWDHTDLSQIATRGFLKLNALDRGDLTARLVKEAFQSPHLMQEFCRELCKRSGILETQAAPKELLEPDWQAFYAQLAPDTSKAAFDLLARGPRQRSDRKVRRLSSGQETDIYGAILRAIAHTGPLTQITYEQLRAAVREVLADDPPQRHEVTRVLEEMAKIAKDQLEGEPVVDYDSALATLFISDPYFAYWLRWGSHNTDPMPSS